MGAHGEMRSAVTGKDCDTIAMGLPAGRERMKTLLLVMTALMALTPSAAAGLVMEGAPIPPVDLKGYVVVERVYHAVYYEGACVWVDSNESPPVGGDRDCTPIIKIAH